MPKLQELRKIVTITLPKSGAKVDVWDGFSALDIEKINRYTNKYDGTSLIQMTALLIKKWDFTDDNDKVVPITEEAIQKLHMEDLYKILTESKIDTDFLGKEGQDED